MTQATESLSPTSNAGSKSLIHSDAGVMDGVPLFRGTRVPVRNLFDFLSDDKDVDAFIEAFPSVGRDQAMKAIEMATSMLEMYAYGDAAKLDELCEGDSVIHSDRQIMSGTPVFKGTRMTVSTLFDNLAFSREAGSISGFLENYATFTTREQVIAAVRMASQALENYAYECASR